jgi:hypothetical protein
MTGTNRFINHVIYLQVKERISRVLRNSNISLIFPGESEPDGFDPLLGGIPIGLVGRHGPILRLHHRPGQPHRPGHLDLESPRKRSPAARGRRQFHPHLVQSRPNDRRLERPRRQIQIPPQVGTSVTFSPLSSPLIGCLLSEGPPSPFTA